MMVLLLFTMGAVRAQDADTYFKNKDYRNAAAYYEREVRTDPCKYLNKAKAHIALKEFYQAQESLRAYVEKCSSADKAYASKLGALLTRDDDELLITNIGSTVNTSGVEAVPRISNDGNTIYFKAEDREGGYGGEDIFYSVRNTDGSWSKPKALNDLNTDSHEALYGVSGDGNIAVLFGNYEGSFGNGDIFYSILTPEGWSMPCNLGGSINTDGWEAQATLGSDGRTLFFVSTRKGGMGGADIYVTQLTNEGWTKPVNLGSTVNTSGDENRPVIAADGKTLYFASDGHFGFGGKDVFMTRRTGDSWTEWSTPKNLGRYFNTLGDDQDLSITSNGVRGYTVKYDDIEGYGDYDIYQFVLPLEMRPEEVFNVYGSVRDEHDSAAAVLIRYYDWDSGKEVATASSRASDGAYRVALPSFKKYKVVISTMGYLYFTDVLDLSDPSKLLGKQSFSKALSGERANLTRIRADLDRYNILLDSLIRTESEDIGKAYTEIQALSAKYRQSSMEMNDAIYRSKYDWLGQENTDRNIVKDYSLQSITIGASFELKDIQFDLGKATLRPASMAELNKLVDIMDRSNIAIELGGHTDNTGDDASNMKLSQDRVNSVMGYLVSKGVDAGRMTAVGYGETAPIASNDTDPGRQKNRRVEVKITEIRPREGTDVATGEIDPELPEAEETATDLLPLFQSAARKGGLPENSPCRTGVQFLHAGTTPVAIEPAKPVKPARTLKSVDPIERNQYYLRAFSLHALDFGTKATGPTLGGGLSIVSRKFTEFHLEAYMPKTTPDNDDIGDMIGGARMGIIKNVQLTEAVGLPIFFGIGLDSYLFAFEDEMDTTNTLLPGLLTLPVGLRYVHQLGTNTVVSPEVFYNVGLLHSKVASFNKASWLRVGVNARWRFVQGGLFLNVGKVVNYPGFRVGLTF